MKNIVKITVLLNMLFCFSKSLEGQIFYVEDFGNQTDVEANWISGGTNNGTVNWVWSDNPSVAIFDNQPAFDSETASNGFFYFDSDMNGPFAHNVTLSGPQIDCSNQSVVFASFQNQYTISSNIASAYLGVSTDGTNFTYYPILDNTELNDFTVAVQNVGIDISDQAAGQSAVYLQFRWTGNYEYAWKIDDLVLTNVDPNPPYDLTIKEIQLPPNFLQPTTQLDVVRFKLETYNNGSMPQTNVVGTAEVIVDGQTIYSTESTTIPTLAPSGTTILEFDGVWIQEGSGPYTVKYTVAGDNADTNPFDNTVSKDFIIDSNVYSKDDNNINFHVQPPDVNENWETGNFYLVVDEGYSADKVYFSAFSNAPLEGESVTVNLYQVTEDLNVNNFTDDDVTLIGSTQHTFTSELNFDIVEVEFDGGPIPLEANTEYIVTIVYPPELSAIFSPIAYPFQVASVLRMNQWYLGGFGDAVTIVARLQIAVTTANDEIHLSEKNKIVVYPNPTNSMLNITIDLEENANQSTISITDAAGRLMYKKDLGNIQKEQFVIDVTKYAAGVYSMKLVTENGVRVEHFVVQ